MSEPPVILYGDAEILGHRPPKNAVDPRQPYAFFVEQERTAKGHVEDVATIFLTNRECPFRCLMCDLWKNTTDVAVPTGAIPEQIEFALARLPAARHIKLYNSGNFFDPQAVPRADYAAIADRVRDFETVIVENHPRLCGDHCLRIADRLAGRLEIAIGLETVHPQVLPALNKRMTIRDFDEAVRFLCRHGLRVRSFILLRPPFLDEQQGITWALRSLAHAFDVGVECCSIIATRGGNGIMERLARQGHFSRPQLHSLEIVLESGIAMQRGRVLADLWDLGALCLCPRCGPLRIERLRHMNWRQQVLPRVACDCGVDG
jgi:archaeosine synthase beta-subunit